MLTCQLSPVEPDFNLVFADARSGERNVLPILDPADFSHIKMPTGCMHK